MYKALLTTLISIFLLCIGCRNDHTGLHNMPRDTQSMDSSSVMCLPCDKSAIDNMNQKYDHLTRSDVESFLCSLRPSCNWKVIYKKSNSFDEDLVFDTLIDGFYREFDLFIEIFEQDKNIDLNYILTLLSIPAAQDLPQRGILEKLEMIKNRTPVQEKIHVALKKGVKDGDAYLQSLRKNKKRQ